MSEQPERVTDELLQGIEDWVRDQPDLLSSGVPACLQELDNCRSGLAYLDHLFGVLLDQRDEARATWRSVEARAAKAARENAPKAVTAREINGLITEYINERRSDAEAQANVDRAERRLEKVERWMRTLEKRLGAAQSAQNGHEQLARYGGGEGVQQ